MRDFLGWQGPGEEPELLPAERVAPGKTSLTSRIVTSDVAGAQQAEPHPLTASLTDVIGIGDLPGSRHPRERGHGGGHGRGHAEPAVSPDHITVRTAAPGPMGSGYARTTVGVGEHMTFTAPAGASGTWTASGGSPTNGSGATFAWIAPVTPSPSVNITFTGTPNASLSMNVIAPNALDMQSIYDLSGNYAPGTAGAGMNLRIGVLPYDVSFGGIFVREIGDGEHGAARGVGGYFERFSAGQLRHAPTAAWSDITDNNFTDTARDQGDTAASRPGAYPAPWRRGTYYWDIPYHYRVQGTSGDGFHFATVRQTFAMADDGTVTVTKGNESVSRAPGGAAPAPAPGAAQAPAPAQAGAPPAAHAAAPHAPVQREARGAALDDPFAVHQTAAHGVSGTAQSLPHYDAIQRSFGHHDVSGVRAHVGGVAADAAYSIGASAYATGDDVAFAASPDLRQAAHETAHVVQQRGGVRLDGGVGRSGDAYERHADAVADLVVRGQSAEALLDTMAHRGSAGGAAVQREDRDGDGVEDAPSTEHWERGPDGRLTDAAVERLRQRTIEATRAGSHGDRGTLAEAEAGSFENQRSWSDARINRALRLLADLDHGTDTTSRGARVRGRRGATDRPVLAWHSHLDDLGLPDRERSDHSTEYQNMLEFADRLDSLSIATMDLEYNPEFTAGGMDSMPTIRLAGAAVGVHPRALYFAAAAQMGMDARAGRAEGGGHYMPAGGFRTLLNDISNMAGRIATERTPGRHRRGTPARRDREGTFENGGAIYNALRSELDLCLRVMEDQAHETDTVTGYHHTEHREPALRDFLVPRADRIRELPATATDETAAAAARALSAVLEGLPGASSRRHGFGSIDAHGTEHAMGVAVDIYNGAGSGGSQRNFAPPSEYWPFIHRLIERHGGGDTGIATTARPDSWSDLSAGGADQATQARAIATLVRNFGVAEADAIEAEAAPDPDAARADHHTATQFEALRNRARRGLIDRRTRLTAARRSSGLDWAMADDVQAEIDSLNADIEVIGGTSHADLVLLLQRHIVALTNLENHIESLPTVGPPPPPPTTRRGRPRRRAADPLPTVGPDDHDGTRLDLSDIAGDLEAMGTEVDAAVTRDQTTDLSELVRTRAFRRWLTTASDADTPLYDQATTMVEAFDDVEGTHFYGGHHWEITPIGETSGAERGSILEDASGAGGTGNYATTLDHDMDRRTPEQLERILDIMAESEGGRHAIFGSAELVPASAAAATAPTESVAPISTTDGTSDSVPIAGGGGGGATGSSTAAPTGPSPLPAGADATLRTALAEHLPNLDEVLGRVHARVVAPYEGATGESASMLRDLRDRGIYVTPVTH